MATDTTEKPLRNAPGDVQKEAETLSDRAYPLHRSRDEMGTHGGQKHRTPDEPPPPKTGK